MRTILLCLCAGFVACGEKKPSGDAQCAGKPDGASCSGGDACTLGDTCKAGLCGAGARLACVASDSCHLAGQCDPASGACSNPVNPGATCNGPAFTTFNSPAVDGVVSVDGVGTVTAPPLSTTGSNELLLAFAASAGNGPQALVVSGGGLGWELVRRANGQPGSAEIWKAVAAAPLTDLRVQSVQAQGGLRQSLTVVALLGAAGVGSSGASSQAGGAPSVQLAAASSESWFFGVGNDSRANPGQRGLISGQTSVHEFADGTGDYWVQRLSVFPAPATATLGATAPASQTANFAAVEVQAIVPADQAERLDDPGTFTAAAAEHTLTTDELQTLVSGALFITDAVSTNQMRQEFVLAQYRERLTAILVQYPSLFVVDPDTGLLTFTARAQAGLRSRRLSPSTSSDCSETFTCGASACVLASFQVIPGAVAHEVYDHLTKLYRAQPAVKAAVEQMVARVQALLAEGREITKAQLLSDAELSTSLEELTAALRIGAAGIAGSVTGPEVLVAVIVGISIVGIGAEFFELEHIVSCCIDFQRSPVCCDNKECPPPFQVCDHDTNTCVPDCRGGGPACPAPLVCQSDGTCRDPCSKIVCPPPADLCHAQGTCSQGICSNPEIACTNGDLCDSPGTCDPFTGKCSAPMPKCPNPQTCDRATGFCCVFSCPPGICGQPDGCGGICGCTGAFLVCDHATSKCVSPLSTITSGDPHLTTWDGTHYDFQLVGEFVLVRDGSGFEVQVRQAPYGQSRTIAINVAVAVKIGDDRVVVHAGDPVKLSVNGAGISLSGDLALESGRISSTGSQILVETADGRSVTITPGGSQYLNLTVADLPSAGASLVGLAGNANGQRSDDFQLRAGTILQQPLSHDDLYKTFANSWRISDAESLFDYGEGETTATFTDPTFPDAATSIASLPPATYTQAQTICAANGVTQPAALLDCIFDVGSTADQTFASNQPQLPQQAGANIGLDFGFSPGTMILNGSATFAVSRLRLTQAGFTGESASAFYPVPVSVGAFVSDFELQLASPSADGITFIIQRNDPRALGAFGGGLGYSGIPNSVALKFDIFDNSGEGLNSTGVYVGGAFPSVPATPITGVDLHSGHLMKAHVTYDGASLALALTDEVTSGVFTASFPVDVVRAVGGATAYVGFGSGTGGATSTADIVTWTYVVPP